MFKVNHSENGFCSMTFAPLWVTLHMVSLTYPNYPTSTQRKEYESWFLGFKVVLPCSSCRTNFPKNLESIKFDSVIDMCSRTAFAKCIWRLHNEVNRVLKKDVFVRFEDMNRFYEQLRASDCDTESCSKPLSQPQCVIRFQPDNQTERTQLLTIDKNCIQNFQQQINLFDP